jgi:hypothetical protein
MTRKLTPIEQTLVNGDFLFTTHRYRCLYIGRDIGDKAKWRADHPGTWSYRPDVFDEPEPLGTAETEVKTEGAGPDVRKVDDDDNVAMVDNLAVDRSPAGEPTSPPTPVKADVTVRSAKAKPLPPAKAAVSEAEEAKTERTPLGATGGKQGRSSGSQIKTQKPPAGTSKATPKLSPERMRIVLDSYAVSRIKGVAAAKAGIFHKTLDYWLKQSAAGEDKYDVEWHGETYKFHEHFEAATREAEDRILDFLTERANGYDKTLTNRNGVIYHTDPFFWYLGYRGCEAYRRDKNGNPIPQTVRKFDKKAAFLVLALRRPEKWAKNRKKLTNSSAASVRARKWKAGARMMRDAQT